MKGRVLIIAGSDSGGGAGMQGDCKTVSALGSYAATAITAVTAQNTLGVSGVHAVPPAMVAAQITAVLEDIGADAIKTGMLFDADIIKAVAGALQNIKAPLIIDPVMLSKSGAVLLHDRAIVALKDMLFPIACLLTPNIPEAEKILGTHLDGVGAMKHAAEKLATLGPKAVLLKGGHGSGDVIIDVLFDGHGCHVWESPRIKTRHTHGTGCALASAIATLIAQGFPLKEAVANARAYLRGAIEHTPQLGAGHGPLNHFWM